MEEALERLGFEVKRPLRSHGNVSVWEASYQDKLVVLKCLGWGGDYLLQNAWLEEALVQHQFNHPNICKMLGLRVCERGLIIVLEHMQSDLAAYLVSQQAPLDESNLWSLLREVAAALAYAQSRVFAN